MLGILTRILTRIPENTATNLNEFLLKTKNFQENFYSIFMTYIKFWTFWKKLEHPRVRIFEIIDCEISGYLNE